MGNKGRTILSHLFPIYESQFKADGISLNQISEVQQFVHLLLILLDTSLYQTLLDSLNAENSNNFSTAFVLII